MLDRNLMPPTGRALPLTNTSGSDAARVPAGADSNRSNQTPRALSVLLVCDSPVLRVALSGFIADAGTGHEVCALDCVYAAPGVFEAQRPELVVLDMNTPHAGQALNYFTSVAAEAILIALVSTPSEAELLCTTDIDRFSAVVRHAPSGVLRQVLGQALQLAQAGDTAALEARDALREAAYGTLTRKEAEIGEMLVQSNKAIAKSLCITERTVKNHVSRILCKTGSRNRREAYALLQAMKGHLH